MTKNEALYSFFSGFGLTAYPTSSIPEDVTFPYLTYENTIGCAGDPDVNITVNLWYHTASEKQPNTKVEQIADAIGRGGVQIPYTGGTIWVKRATPFAIARSDAADPQLKQRALNLVLQFN